VLPAVHDSADARTFMRFFAPSAQPIHREQPFSGFAYPSHVASLRLPCASTPYSLDGLPGVLSTRRALGASPYRALPDRDRQRLSAGHPLMRLATDRSRQTLSLLLFLHLPKIGSHKTSSSAEPAKARPSWICGARRFRRFRHCCRSGLASGVSSLCRLGHTVAGFLHVRRPWLSWASSSLGRSPSEPWPQRLSRSASRPPAATPRAELANE
jgi:hypothetical protein